MAELRIKIKNKIKFENGKRFSIFIKISEQQKKEINIMSLMYVLLNEIRFSFEVFSVNKKMQNKNQKKVEITITIIKNLIELKLK